MGFYNVLIWKRFTFYSVCAQAFASLCPQHLALGLLCPQPFEILYFKIFCNSNVVFSAQQKHVHGHIRTSWTMQILVQWFLSHFRSSLIDFFPLSLFFPLFFFYFAHSPVEITYCDVDLTIVIWVWSNEKSRIKYILIVVCSLSVLLNLYECRNTVFLSRQEH